MKAALLSAALVLCGCATTSGHEGTAADIASTAVALQVPGVVEANPLALIGIPIRIAIVEHAKTLPREEAQPILDASRAVGWGAAANNVIVALGGGHVSALIGLLVGLHLWSEGEQEREFWRMCAWHKQQDPRITSCNYTT